MDSKEKQDFLQDECNKCHLMHFKHHKNSGVTYYKGGDSTPDVAVNDATVGHGLLYNYDS